MSKIEEELAPAQMEEQPKNQISEEQAGQIAQAVKSVLIKYSEENDAKFDSLNAKLSEMAEKLVELSAQPASKPIKATPVQMSSEPNKPFSKFLNSLNK